MHGTNTAENIIALIAATFLVYVILSNIFGRKLWGRRA